jgi:hypothetical protein
MPRNPRRYDLERKYDSKPEVKERRAARNRARAAYEKENGPVPAGHDVAHKKALVKGGAKTAMSNLKTEPASKNRSFARTKSAKMK